MGGTSENPSMGDDATQSQINRRLNNLSKEHYQCNHCFEMSAGERSFFYLMGYFSHYLWSCSEVYLYLFNYKDTWYNLPVGKSITSELKVNMDYIALRSRVPYTKVTMDASIWALWEYMYPKFHI